MELSDSKIKKSYIFPKESICPETEPCTFEPKLKKKKFPPPKNVLTFSYISGNGNPEKKFIIFQETETLQKSLLCQEMELFTPSSKNEKKIHPEKLSYIFSNESFSYISGNRNPEKFLIFKETKLLFISGSNFRS